MIFEEISLYNFGIYQGNHTISLDSPEHNKPIILIGALNGAGKTTFLDALQLVLYGKFAKCSNRGKLGYLAYLEKNINAFSNEKSAGISLRFRHGDNKNKPQVYEIKRHWAKEEGKDCKEYVSVFFNGKYDQLLSEHWDEFVNEFIPQSISELFFFDGEKIEHLADPKRSAELVKTGIEALLGLELLSTLSADLNELRKKKREKLLNKEDASELLAIKEQLGLLENKRIELNIELNKLTEKLKDEEDELALIHEQLVSTGADKINTKKILEQEKNVLDQKIFTLKHDLLKLISGPLPLGLTQNLLKKAEYQAHAEKNANIYKDAEALLSKQKEKMLDLLSSQFDKIELSNIKNDFEKIMHAEQSANTIDCFLNTDPIYFAGLEDKISEDKEYSLALLNEIKEVEDSIILIDRKISTIPTFDSVKNLLLKCTNQEGKLHSIKKEKENLCLALNSINSEIKNIENKYNSLLLKNNAINFEQKRQNQIINHIDTLRNIVISFNKKLVIDNIEKLERKIKGKFDQLKRKDSLIHSIKIDPISYSMTLYASNKSETSADRLSAGERQLLSIAILWGLADSSGKELPTIIDTPMGRLDGEHRTRLIDKYFPNAASQVILLSTDEEIYGQYYNNLKPFLAHEYHIIYDEELNSSYFLDGYLERAK